MKWTMPLKPVEICCFRSLTHTLPFYQALRLRGQLEFPDQRSALSGSSLLLRLRTYCFQTFYWKLDGFN